MHMHGNSMPCSVPSPRGMSIDGSMDGEKRRASFLARPPAQNTPRKPANTLAVIRVERYRQTGNAQHRGFIQTLRTNSLSPTLTQDTTPHHTTQLNRT
mmetsp:Transcript_19439/g.46969  ORF Transcript_19439/g.46969 Transcript_19439/m.46969 type:complete len:98 (-) Transcript_19439:313-606(-)